MVEMEHIVQQLEQSLGISLKLKTLNEQEYGELTRALAASQDDAVSFGGSQGKRSTQSKAKSPQFQDGQARSRTTTSVGAYENEELGEIWIPIQTQQKPWIVIAAAQGDLTVSEIRLIELWLSALRGASSLNAKSGTKAEEERSAQQLGAWLKERLDAGEQVAELPEEVPIRLSLSADMVPFLLLNESEHAPAPSYKALQRLLRSYFDGDIVLVPLHEKEWLILAQQQLLVGIIDDKEELTADGDQESLALFCMGLYELISTEWVGDFHISAIPAVNALHALPQAVNMLRETMTIGRTFQVKEHIHLSTGLHLERLVYSIPEYQRNLFLREYAAGHTDLFEDSETLSTLESFFELDCNVSETAKHLYIHRNTLLYRLDKIKQETGLDVRSFSDAVLVKITLLLYKVTKRK
ncbi:PucR family transcriptional regulator [Paenibacillus ihbetae]|uniref:PucR family transcriptional regulator n=1 Tax=Paenibacillus ihbetae TaxID=1870820 RepID=A0A1B2E0Q4_9BACL|nr:helix-turn-helix domain-containing protein [Paenibacillus ihbetae]ANY73511.1 PucR family transcriptional regulator [Paenibacillus ihbetae]